MNYYNVKLHWYQINEGKEGLKKISKNFIVFDTGVTECEIRIKEWTPSNYQDAVVEGIKLTTIVSLTTEGDSETYWYIKLGNIDEKPFTIVLNGNNIDELNKKLKRDYYDCDVLAIQKLKEIVDFDLINLKIVETAE